MLKNLSVTTSKNINIKKNDIHGLVKKLKSDIDFEIESVVINFVSSEEIIPINKSYLNHDYSTDIITFNYSGENYTLDSEIFISLDDAYVNSKKYKVSLEDELVRLVIHGFLHLVGYDDKSTNDKKVMKRLEDKLVNKYQNSINKIN